MRHAACGMSEGASLMPHTACLMPVFYRAAAREGDAFFTRAT
jgi:hypothetical protein